MKMSTTSFQYAQLPKYEYQSVQRQYQTFDRHTLKFSYHPILHPASDSLTTSKDQDNGPTTTGDAPSTAEAAVVEDENAQTAGEAQSTDSGSKSEEASSPS